ncbi:D-glycerate dehydrogenase [Nordella sp. HKS 07]|uniref:2-hydroxyacid dehydrogenase n=1 Tax=Nordella sp. HKS 07 TaxID=2712222 RepID=UPI0013E11298|nr:D-glycerate dehydrogenase [Nordella sp. HKS 07]QIG51307.1 D-glycerate dehydrogenase [Nordella sp. HKS 07]
MASALPRLLVTRRLPKAVEARLAKAYQAQFNADDQPMSEADILAGAADKDALLITPMDKSFATGIIARLPPSIKIVATFSVGHEHVDIAAARLRNIAVTNTPDVLTDATADIALLLILGAARGASWGERMVRDDRWTSWSPTAPLGFDVTGRRLGILGMGRIGQAVAKRAKGFDMELHYYNRRPVAAELAHGARYHKKLDDMLPFCDFLSINCASTPETRGLVNDGVIAGLPDGAIIVNTARGDIVDDDALIAALNSGKLAAAGLDVFRNEPRIDPRYRGLDNVFLLPHLGSATRDTRIAMGMRAVDNLDAFFAGRKPGDLLT